MNDTLLYIIRDGDYVKIGVSNDPSERLRAIQTGNPREVSLVKTCNGSTGKEKAIHKKLKKFHVRGEWFELEALELAKGLFDTLPNHYRGFVRKNCDPIYYEYLAEDYPKSDPYFEILAEDYRN